MVLVKYSRRIPHGIMFHHFHSGKHYRGQGSISQKDFDDILQFIGLDRILNPQEWVRRLDDGQLVKGDLCITLDDGLLSQFDIALPVLEKYNLKAFWFIYSNVFEGYLGKFEIYRVFRSKFFKNIADFYQIFFKKVFESESSDKAMSILNDTDARELIRKFPFYTIDDIRFRIIRDRVLSPIEFEAIIDEIIRSYGLNISELSKDLWMTNENLVYLSNHGHSIGLHSYSHPMVLSNLLPEEQRREYSKNYDHIKRVTTQSPIAVAHPVNSYNEETLKIINRLGISCGFRANMYPRREGDQLNRSRYEIAREDHSNINKIMSSSSMP